MQPLTKTTVISPGPPTNPTSPPPLASSNNNSQVQVTIPPPSTAEDHPLVARLTEIINKAYRLAKKDFFDNITTYARTDDAQLRDFLRKGELVLAYKQSPPPSPPVSPLSAESLIGCVRIVDVSPTHADFELLACDPDVHGKGAGRALVKFAEQHARDVLGKSVMMCGALLPLDLNIPDKDFLCKWYERMGYELVRVGDFAVDYPKDAARLIIRLEYRRFEKRLV